MEPNGRQATLRENTPPLLRREAELKTRGYMMTQHSPATERSASASRGPLLVVLAALCWGLSGGMGGMLTAQGWSPLVVSLYRGAIGLLVVLLWLALRPGGSGLTSGRLWCWAVVAGLGVAGNFSFYFLSIAHGSVAVAAPLMYSAPVFVYLVSFACRLERPTRGKWAAIAMVMLGIVLLTGIHEAGAAEVTPIAAGAGLLSGLSYAVFIFGFKYAAPHGSPQAILAIASRCPSGCSPGPPTRHRSPPYRRPPVGRCS